MGCNAITALSEILSYILHNNIQICSFSHTEKFRKQLQRKIVQK